MRFLHVAGGSACGTVAWLPFSGLAPTSRLPQQACLDWLQQGILPSLPSLQATDCLLLFFCCVRYGMEVILRIVPFPAASGIILYIQHNSVPSAVLDPMLMPGS